MIVVVPTARSVDLDHLRPLIESGARFIVVDDSEGRVTIDHPQFEVHTWSDQARLLGDLAGAIPRGNGACRDYGFLLAWRDAGPDEVIVALDDDCKLEDDAWADQAEAALARSERPCVLGAGRHWNVLDLYADLTTCDLFPRGFPYSHRPGYRPSTFGEPVEVAPVFSLGLWRGIFDVNAIDKISGPAYIHDDIELQHESAVVPAGSLFSLCSMNMVFRGEAIPAVYQLPMAVDVMDGWRVDRYGDIWGGFILKHLADLRGDAVVAGGPMIRHLKAGDYTRNIWQEHICHLVNDEFLELLDAFAPTASGPGKPSYLELMAGLTDHLGTAAADASPLLAPYLVHLRGAMGAWIAALDRFS